MYTTCVRVRVCMQVHGKYMFMYFVTCTLISLSFQWDEGTSVACEVTVRVCGFSAGAQENWLITQHISRELAGGQRLQKVTARFQFTLNGCDISRQCIQSFDVFKWQTSTLNCSQKH